jgi:hypothetical protein
LFGDLNNDGVVNVADWQQFRGGQQINMTGFTAAQALAAGDLNGDFRNDHADFVLFKSVFDSVNGAGAFVDMLASVPEPVPAIPAAIGYLYLASLLRPRRHGRRA